MHVMAFHWGFVETILFDGWQTKDLSGVIGSMIGIVLLAMIYEALKNYREHLNVNFALSRPQQLSRRKSMLSMVHLVQTALQGVQVTLGYFLMFIFMTYNVYLCIAVVLGSILGYFIFSWNNPRCDINECCS